MHSTTTNHHIYQNINKHVFKNIFYNKNSCMIYILLHNYFQGVVYFNSICYSIIFISRPCTKNHSLFIQILASYNTSRFRIKTKLIIHFMVKSFTKIPEKYIFITDYLTSKLSLKPSCLQEIIIEY